MQLRHPERDPVRQGNLLACYRVRSYTPRECWGRANALRPPSFLPVGEDTSSSSGKGRHRIERGTPATSTPTVASPESRRRWRGAAFACFPARTALLFSSHISEFHKGIRLSGFTADQRIGIPEPVEQREQKDGRPVAPVRLSGLRHNPQLTSPVQRSCCAALCRVHPSTHPFNRRRSHDD